MQPLAPGYNLLVYDDNGERSPADLAEQLLIMIREFAT